VAVALGLIAVIFGIAFVWARRMGPVDVHESGDDEAAGLFAEEAAPGQGAPAKAPVQAEVERTPAERRPTER
jgi:hypothetical protein